MLPDDVKYTAEHEWVRLPTQDGGTVRVGITDHAQEALGDIVYVSLPPAGTEVTAGEPFGEVESTKSVNDVYAPVSGTIAARNDALDATPELLNSDPYGEGWMVEITPAGGGADALAGLLDATDYRKLTGAA
ncbi:MAG: glycine cleavage system protein GcvH [Actinomycetota bacterium]|nr:glycine cleavage system protein GcvH [Actinomycetota bacterium]